MDTEDRILEMLFHVHEKSQEVHPIDPQKRRRCPMVTLCLTSSVHWDNLLFSGFFLFIDKIHKTRSNYPLFNQA